MSNGMNFSYAPPVTIRGALEGLYDKLSEIHNGLNDIYNDDKINSSVRLSLEATIYCLKDSFRYLSDALSHIDNNEGSSVDECPD